MKTLWEKEKLLLTSNFSLSHSVFHTSEELSPFNFFQIENCRLRNLSIWNSVKFVVLEKVIHVIVMGESMDLEMSRVTVGGLKECNPMKIK